MNDDLDKLAAHPHGQLAMFGTAYHAAMEEWLLRCLRPVDPREWSQYMLTFSIAAPSNLTLTSPGGRVLGTFKLVEKDRQLFFHGLVFE